jgi:hypothetical protein
LRIGRRALSIKEFRALRAPVGKRRLCVMAEQPRASRCSERRGFGSSGIIIMRLIGFVALAGLALAGCSAGPEYGAAPYPAATCSNTPGGVGGYSVGSSYSGC